MKKQTIFLVSAVTFCALAAAGLAVWFTKSPSSSSGPSLRMFMTLTDTRPEAHNTVGSGGLPSNTLRSAVSTDGYTFTFDPQEWLTSDDMADPTAAVNENGTWVVASGTGTGSLRVASTQSCPTPSSFPEVFRNGGGIPDIIPVGDGFRVYYSGDGGIHSAFSEDGTTFVDESGLRLAPPFNLNLVADPAVTQRADGTYVMYFKATKNIEKTPYNHLLYRATSEDGLTWAPENTVLIEHIGVPGVYTDASGTVWIYYLNFAKWPQERESVWATYEKADGTLAESKPVTFSPALPSYLWVNDPDPVLVPASVRLEDCE